VHENCSVSHGRLTLALDILNMPDNLTPVHVVRSRKMIASQTTPYIDHQTAELALSELVYGK
jgi:hypothetical protein